MDFRRHGRTTDRSERATRDDLLIQCRPFLQPGEEAHEAIAGASGTGAGIAFAGLPRPLIGWLVGGRLYAIVVTDRSVILFSRNPLTMNISKPVARLPRRTRLDPTPPNGAPGAGWVTVDGKALLVTSQLGMASAFAVDAALDDPPAP